VFGFKTRDEPLIERDYLDGKFATKLYRQAAHYTYNCKILRMKLEE